APSSCVHVAGDYNTVLAWSTNSGRNWSSPVPVDPEYPWGGCVNSAILIEPGGAIDILLEDFNTTPTHNLTVARDYFTQSTNGGVLFSAPVPVSNDTIANSTWWVDASLSRDNSGTLYAAYDSSNSTGNTVSLVTSRTDGASWQSVLEVNPKPGPSLDVAATVLGGENGTSYVAWTSNNSSFGWRTFEAPVSGNGTIEGPIVVVSNFFGANQLWGDGSVGLSRLARGVLALSWGLAVRNGPTVLSEIFAAVVGESPPGAPTVTSVHSGIAQISFTWNAAAGGAAVSGFNLSYRASTGPVTNVTFGPLARSASVGQLSAGVPYTFVLVAFNPGGFGPPAPVINVTLSAWGVVTGSVFPANAIVRLDGSPVVVSSGTYAANATSGPHILSASASNYDPATHAVLLPWNGSTQLDLVLNLSSGEMRGYVQPNYAHVTFDGVLLPTTLAGEFESGAPGNSSHQLILSAFGFVTSKISLVVPPNATAWENVSLVPDNGSLKISVSPVTSQVTVSGAAVTLDVYGTANLSRTPGSYLVKAVAAGYTSDTRTVTVSSLRISYANISLQSVGPTSGNNGSQAGTNYTPYLIGAGIAIVAVIAAIFLVQRRRGGGPGGERRPPPPPEPVEEEGSFLDDPPAA
ncbi:MAG: fibronectin type III domain-containing protein, partial [Thermoplasmata archaeon]|nr:fibronectin type III domain-containing protein [Thermoplasmata archaeon]